MADNKKIYQLTEEGRKDLEAQLDYLKNTARKQNIIAIQDAMSQGDLSENADYSAAREEQSRIAARIAEIEEILQHSKIISTKDETDEITLGKKVKLLINGCCARLPRPWSSTPPQSRSRQSWMSRCRIWAPSWHSRV